jgi:pimeloyl-ACP methyl ester carboxylesterase
MANLSPFRGLDKRAQFLAKYESIMRGWPVPCDEHDLDTAYGQTHIAVSGPPSAPPLVLLHGASATLTMWLPIVRELSASYRCYCIDTITEANKSVAAQPIRGVPEYVDWLRQIFSGLGITPGRVTGLSYGGWLAALLALHAPEYVSHLVLVCPAATLAPLPVQFYVRMLTPGLLRSRSLARRSLQWLSVTPDAESDPVVDLIAESFIVCRPIRPEIVQPTVFTNDELGQLRAPTAVLIGDREVIYRGGPTAALACARRHIPYVRTRLLPNAGHMLTLDCPELLTTEILTALADPAPDGRA